MLSRCLSETPLASFEPDMAGLDTLGDRLREALAPFIPRTQQAAAFAALDAALEENEKAGGAPDREQIADGLLQAIYGDTSLAPEIRMIAAAARKRFGKDGRSYQAMGDEFGVTRACIHAHSRRIERTGIKCRSDKDADARQTSTAKAMGRRRSAPASGVLRSSRGRRLFSFFLS